MSAAAGAHREPIHVRGGASPEELAAVLAVVRARPAPAHEDTLQRWRRLRQAVIRKGP